MEIKIYKGDITKLEVDAIVNAANKTLRGGDGVDGAIHRAAGKELLAECRKLGKCETGGAKITKGYKLPAKYVIHTVGPVWYGGIRDEAELLAESYRNSLRLALANDVHSIAFPAISTGIYHYPKDEAAKIAVKTILEEAKDTDLVIWLVAYDNETEDLYRDELYYVKNREETHDD